MTHTSSGQHVPHFNPSCSHFVDVFGRFTHILQLYFAYFVIQWSRMIIVFFGLCATTHKARIARVLDVTGTIMFFYGLSILIILNVYRFQPSGKYVSMDFLSIDEKKAALQAYFALWDSTGVMPDSGQTFRGIYLLSLVIYMWCGGFLVWTLQLLCGVLQLKKIQQASPPIDNHLKSKV